MIISMPTIARSQQRYDRREVFFLNCSFRGHTLQYLTRGRN